MAVGSFFPLGAEVPVVGDVVIIKDHQGREVGEYPGDPWKATAKLIDLYLFAGITLLFLRAQLRRLGEISVHGVGDQASRYMAITSAKVTR